MINIEFYNNGLIINGHANYNKKGCDIYCAAVSAISQSAINWFNEKDIYYKINNGYLFFCLINKSSENQYLLNLLKIQLKTLNNSDCKNYIRFNTFKKDINNEKE